MSSSLIFSSLHLLLPSSPLPGLRELCALCVKIPCTLSHTNPFKINTYRIPRNSNSIDSKQLTRGLNSLDATLTKNRGGGWLLPSGTDFSLSPPLPSAPCQQDPILPATGREDPLDFPVMDQRSRPLCELCALCAKIPLQHLHPTRHGAKEALKPGCCRGI